MGDADLGDLFSAEAGSAGGPNSTSSNSATNPSQERSNPLENKSAALMHILPKAGALTLFLLSPNSTGFFQAVIVLLALDFWATKNVTGRRLVGLRWWNGLDEGWIFESRPEGGDPGNRADRHVFWMGLFVPLILWSLLLVFEILLLKITWAVVALAAVGMLGANSYGYVKCSKDAQKRVKAQAQGIFANAVMGQLWGRGGDT
jgi:golgi apparatus membrane protein TVP23